MPPNWEPATLILFYKKSFQKEKRKESVKSKIPAGLLSFLPPRLEGGR